MSKSTDIWFPFYIGDYIADTMHLSAEEHGAYLLLIIHYWKNQKPIKNEPKTIQNIAKIKFKKLSNVLAFFEEKDGVFLHKRIEKEIEKANKNKELKSQAGKKGMEKRYNKTLTGVITESITEPQQNANPSPSPSPSYTNNISQEVSKYNDKYFLIDEFVLSEPDVQEIIFAEQVLHPKGVDYLPDCFLNFCDEKEEMKLWNSFYKYHQKRQSSKTRGFWIVSWKEHIQRQQQNEVENG